MKEIIQGVLIFIAIVIGFAMITSTIGGIQKYFDQRNQQRIEHCIGQGKSFDDCWLSVYKKYNYQREK